MRGSLTEKDAVDRADIFEVRPWVADVGRCGARQSDRRGVRGSDLTQGVGGAFAVRAKSVPLGPTTNRSSLLFGLWRDARSPLASCVFLFSLLSRHQLLSLP